METIGKYLHNLYRVRPDFVYSVSRDFVRSCQTPIANVAGAAVTTIEGLSPDGSHPLQRAWEKLDVPECGYCQAGQIMTAAALLAKNPKPTDADIYGAFSTEEIEAYKKEAEERWGHTEAYKVSAARAAKLTKEDWKRMHEEADALMRRLTDLLVAGKTPDSPEVQAEIAKHHAGIEVFYPCSMEMYRGLGDMYLADERYSDQYRVFHKDLPEFIVKGMHAFCDARTGK